MTASYLQCDGMLTRMRQQASPAEACHEALLLLLLLLLLLHGRCGSGCRRDGRSRGRDELV